MGYNLQFENENIDSAGGGGLTHRRFLQQQWKLG